MFKKILKISTWALLIILLITTGWFSNRQLKRVSCRNISVRIIKGSPRFLQEEDLEEIIIKIDTSIIGQRMNRINTEKLEQKIQSIESIRNAEVFRSISGSSLPLTGKLIIKIEERNPIVRIKTAKTDYYLDAEGMKIPVSQNFTSRVTVMSGNITEKAAKKELLSFAAYIYSHPFWKAQIEQIVVQKNNELLIIPRVGDQVIEFGASDNFEEKLRNLKAVYQHGFNKTGWDKYKTINLKYKNQVICTKS